MRLKSQLLAIIAASTMMINIQAEESETNQLVRDIANKIMSSSKSDKMCQDMSKKIVKNMPNEMHEDMLYREEDMLYRECEGGRSLTEQKVKDDFNRELRPSPLQ